MQIHLNGQPRSFDEPLHITDLLATLGLGERRVAVEVNREIVPRSQHATHRLIDGDRVELVHAMGGG